MRKKLVVLFAVLATAFATAVPAVAEDGKPKGEPPPPVEQSDTGSYIVVMDADPLLAEFDQEDLTSSAAERAADDIAASHEEVLEEEGLASKEIVNQYTNAVNGFSLVISHAQAERLAANPKVARVLPDRLRQKTTDASPTFLGLNKPGGAWTAGYTGEGVVVGVIDTGIWPEHPSFADNGMPAPPISIDDVEVDDDDDGTVDYVFKGCDFGNTAHNANDAPFECNNKLIGARQMLRTYRALIGAEPDEFDSARDDDGHGTHTASTAAGDSGVDASIFGIDYGTISGIAPDAYVVAYKGLGEGGGFSSDLAAAIDQAVADGVDVINYSIGGGGGTIGADDIAFLFANDAGVFVATSAGNSGPGAATVGSPGEVPWLTTVAASSQARFFGGKVVLKVLRDSHEISKEFGDLDSSQHFGSDFWRWFRWWWSRHKYKYISVDGASITPGVNWSKIVDAADISNNGSDLCEAGELDSGSADGAIVLCRRGAVARAEKSQTVLAGGGVGMVLYNNVDADNLFTDSHVVPSVHVNNTDGEIVKEAIASGRVVTAKIETGKKQYLKSAPSITYFSSRGPNTLSPDIIKPDVTAPGHQILAGASPFHSNDDAQGQLFQSISGTSMSSPHVAGIFALIKQAHPDWSASMAKSALMTSAYQEVHKEDRTSQADPFDMGAGHVNPSTRKGGALNPGLVYDAGLFEYAGYTCGEDLDIFSQASCDFLDGLGIPSDASDLNLASIGIAGVPGGQTITRTVTSVADKTSTFKVKVEEPAGYSVSVSPDRIRLAPGETATYEVTFVNDSAPLDEWRFGSLEWKGGGYTVRSPIAVAGAAFDAPDTVTGTGTDGTAMFDVLFGYTGDYEAQAHGLAGDTGQSGTVDQDPDQTWPSADDGDGGVVEYNFTLSGSEFLRITLGEDDLASSDPTNTDIDLYLYKDGDPDNVVAASTAGGTNEIINLANPDDGNYTLVVHGWQVVDPSPGVGFTYHLWDVPTASGGSLVVDSAPTSATLGGTGTIDLSWTGLTPDNYLGAVSHSDGVTQFGLTLVEVDAN